MSNINKVFFTGLIVLISACASIHDKIELTKNDKIEDLSLKISIPEDRFDYIDEHMDSSVASAALFSFIGYVAVAAYNEAHDGEKRSALRDNILDKKYSEIIKNEMIKVLSNKNISVIDTSKIKTNIISDSWGLRRINRDSKLMTPFFEYKITMTSGDTIIWDERNVYTGRAERSYENYKKNHNLISQDLEETFKSVAQEIAYKIVYR